MALALHTRLSTFTPFGRHLALDRHLTIVLTSDLRKRVKQSKYIEHIKQNPRQKFRDLVSEVAQCVTIFQDMVGCAREPRTTVYAKTSCWSVLWDVPCTPKRGVGTYSRLHQGSLVPVRWWSQDSLPKGLKLTKVIIQHARKKLGT